MEDNSFRRYDKSKHRFVGGFSVSAFEALAIGIGYSPKKAVAKPESVEDKVKQMWADNEFIENSGSGVRASSRVPKIVPYGRTLFGK